MKKDSPVYKQYLDFKKQHPEHIFLFRCGDFYETYGDDAAKIAKTLGITLTKNGYGDEYVAMAGFPHHALDGYLPKLVRAGHKVAICDPIVVSNDKKLVKRGITETVEPRKGITPLEAANSRSTFYVKRLQSNGYYPIDKYVWNETEQDYEHFVQKTSQGKYYWRSWGFQSSCVETVEDKIKSMLYFLERNPMIISFNPMKDTRHYDDK